MFIKCTKEELPQVLQAINPNYPVKDFSNAGDERWFIENGVPVMSFLTTARNLSGT